MTRSATENTGWIKEFSRFRKGIVYRLLVGMLLIANLAVILILSFHMHDDYRTRIREIHTQFDHIRDAVLPGLTNSLWISDQEQIQLLLESAEHLFYIEYLELRTNEQEIYRTGKQVSKHVLSRDFDLAYDHGNRKLFLGTLSATASLDKVYDTLWANAKTDIVSHGLIILLLALVILFLFDNLVTRHLVRMAAYARELDIDRLDAESLKLDRNFPAGSKDELEEMVSAFNHMMRRLADSTEELKTANEQLLEEINERRKTAEENEKLENHLRQAQKMEAVGTMAGGIAHDFNNILTIIIGNTELAMDDTPNDGPVRIYLDAILSASHRAKELIKQILAFSRRDTVSKKPFYLCRLVEETMKVLRATIPTTVEIKVTTPAKCRENITECYKVLVDPTQIHQLLMNLCMNAVQAMDEKGVLQVCVDEKIIGDAAAADLQGLEPGVYEYLSVSDTGSGMSPDIIEQIFDPFFTTKEVGKGTGMGLSVVHGIIESHGGKIFVDSESGKGSVFHLYFPVSGTGLAEESQESGPLPTGTDRVLLVDDEEVVVEVWSATLTRLGYRVTAFSNSAEALAAFRSAPDNFDLVITDQTMPNMSGAELAVEFLKLRPDVPIILCTGYSTKISEDETRKLGIKKYCIKPMDQQTLAKTVRGVLDETASKNRRFQVQ